MSDDFEVRLTLPIYVDEDQAEKWAIVENRSGTISAAVPVTPELVHRAEHRVSYWRARFTGHDYDFELVERLEDVSW